MTVRFNFAAAGPCANEKVLGVAVCTAAVHLVREFAHPKFLVFA